MSQDCLFCKIISGEIAAAKVYEDDRVIAFKDIHPQAKIHLLFVHKEHQRNVNEMMANDQTIISQIFLAIKKYTEQEKLDQDGFRVVVNQGKLAGQTVFHTHFHLLSGEVLGHFGR